MKERDEHSDNDRVYQALPIRRRSSQLRGGETEHVAPIDLDHAVEAGGVRLPHAPKSRFGQFNHPITMDGEIQAGVEGKVVGRVTSAVLSPALGVALALGFLKRECLEPGTRVEVSGGDCPLSAPLSAEVAALPFYRRTPAA